jgi:hypothetical protein
MADPESLTPPDPAAAAESLAAPDAITAGDASQAAREVFVDPEAV